jgi:hypothetical protein
MANSDRPVNSFLDLKRIEDCETIRLVDDKGSTLALVGPSTRMFLSNEDIAAKRVAGVRAMRSYYERFRPFLSHYITNDGEPRPLVDNAAFEYFDSNINLDDPNEGTLYYGLVGYPNNTPGHIPLFFHCKLASRMPSWPKFQYYSEWSASTHFSGLGTPYHSNLLQCVLEWAGILKPRHGSAGITLLFDQTQSHRREEEALFPLLKRFPGMDFDDGGGWCTHAGLEKKIRMTNWLTIIDNEFIEQCGGLDLLRKHLQPDCILHQYNGGAVIQAGKVPELGDLNQARIPAAYQTVARALKPIRFENYRWAYIRPPSPLDEVRETQAWIRRFD